MKMKREKQTGIKRGIGILLLAIVLQIAGCGNNPANRVTGNEMEIESENENEELEVHFIDVGQGDATLIKQGDHAMLVDAGDNDKGTTVQSYLQHQGIGHLDYVIGTHPDSDHVGGLDVILYKFPWDTVILPDLEKDTRTYQDVLKVIEDKGEKITFPEVGTVYSLGEAEFTVIAPVKDDYGDSWNDYSVGIVLSFGENRFIFTGDAEEEAELDMLGLGIDLSADVMKASHHGSDTANTMAFLEKVQPEFVVISCEEGNSYGHPRAEAMNNFRSIGAKIFRTDEQGSILAISDGKEITWNCSPSETWKSGEPTGSSQSKNSEKENGDTEKNITGQEIDSIEVENGTGEEEEYVLNTNTHKFHKTSCSSVDDMKEKNKEYTNLSRQEVIEAGYEPCGRCNP